MGLEGIGLPVMWAGFVAFIVAMLVMDMVVFHRKAHEVSLKEALGWSVFWIGLAVAFNIGVYIVEWYKIPIGASLAVVGSLIGGSIMASIRIGCSVVSRMPEPSAGGRNESVRSENCEEKRGER